MSDSRKTKKCLQCGANFGPTRPSKPSEMKRRKFCSLACFHAHARNDIQRLLTRLKANPETGCNLWTGRVEAKGYGRATIGGKQVLIHRAVWEHFRGPVPPGKQLDHTCGVKLCANPDHLRTVTARENSLAATSNNMAARNFRRTACPKCGGPYSAFPSGVRYCKPCRRERQTVYQRGYRSAKKRKK